MAILQNSFILKMSRSFYKSYFDFVVKYIHKDSWNGTFLSWSSLIFILFLLILVANSTYTNN